jgi:hypothetical protein
MIGSIASIAPAFDKDGFCMAGFATDLPATNQRFNKGG